LPPWARRDAAEVKFNPWHDPDDGRFTFSGTGRYFGRGEGDDSAARMHERPPRRGRRSEPFGGFGGGGDGFTGGGAGGSLPAPEAEKHEGRDRQSRSGQTRGPTPRGQAQAEPWHGGRGSDNPRTWRRFRANGYEWRVDETGLFRDLHGTLTLSDNPRRSRTAQARAGGPDRRATDDGGHYIAPRFNGPIEAFNHFAQNFNLNRGRYRVLEDEWYREKLAGKRVDVRIQAVYEGSSRRPSYLNVWFWIDGERHSLKFPNEPLERSRDKR